MDVNQSYLEAVKNIKAAILRSQYRAAASVNKEQLSLYYGIGRYVSENSRKGFWGKGAIEQISFLLHKELPGLRGFSATSIKNMRTFYEEWAPVLNRQPMADDLVLNEKLLLTTIHQPTAGDFDWTCKMNQTFVEFAVRDYSKPLGVATYRVAEDMPERLRKSLPDIEDLKKLL